MAASETTNAATTIEDNLFIDGYVYSGRLNFAELPKGSGTFKNITLNQTFRAAGGIQWDGEHVAIGDLYAAVIYQFDIRGSRGTEVGSTPLSGQVPFGNSLLMVIGYPPVHFRITRGLSRSTTIRLAARRSGHVSTPAVPMESSSASLRSRDDEVHTVRT